MRLNWRFTYSNRMAKHQQPDPHGLFDAKVPRYTSYPPANHFLPDAGRVHQADWLTSVPDGSEVSLYLHIPFCKRLCWFCACRTQGTQSLRPVEAYIDDLREEVEMVRAQLPRSVSLSRLHLGGGTPTILTGSIMERLLDKVFEAFAKGPEFEFSVEIDPTEASDEVLHTLAQFGMNRASIGVQDFDPAVQEAIGRIQTYQQTERVVDKLRQEGIGSLNMDLLYGLPFQTEKSLRQSIEQVIALNPDRVALYGYAHVPWMSKRQVMIDETALPGPQARFALTERAREQLLDAGYEAIGIDHFARPEDGLTRARDSGTLRRNFQGYTDDTSPYLIGLGASAISRFPQGYVQNAAATSIYTGRIRQNGLAGQRGYELTDEDRFVSRMIEHLMCSFAIDRDALLQEFPEADEQISKAINKLVETWPGICGFDGKLLTVVAESIPVIRVVAATLDQFAGTTQAHSAAV